MEKEDRERTLPQNKTNPRKRNSRKKEVKALDGPKIIMDMSWDFYMDEHLQKKVVSQISMAYSFNKASNFSLPMIFTSMNPTWDALFNRVSAFGWNKKIVTFHNESLLDVFQTKDLIYLTADTDNVCMKLDPSKYYIIGCLLDHNSKKGVTRDFALKNNIRMERLPISEHIKMEGRQVLTINHVAEILVRVGNGLSWGEALVQTIPQRKNPILITKQENTQKIEEQSGVFKLCEIQ